MWVGVSLAFAPALQAAIDTPKIAFAPSLDLFSVPSSSINILSIVFCSLTSIPLIVSLISVFIKLTDLRTPFEKTVGHS